MTLQTLDLATLRRPKLLIAAARHGAEDYRRTRDLKRLLGSSLPSASLALRRLTEEEAALEERRRAGDASYSVTRHVDIMIALLAESRLVPART